MLLLTATTDKIQLTTSSAATVDVHASWIDNNAGTITTGRTNTAISSATTTDIVASPASSTTRNVKTLHIFNKDASTSCSVTVVFDQNSTDYLIWKQVLRAGECLEYVEGIGFYVVTDSNASALIFKVLASDDTGGSAVNTVQPWFPTSGTVTLPGATTYRMTGLLKITHGATSHSTGLSFGGTATLTSIDYYAQAHRSAADTIISTFSGIHIASVSNATVDAAGTQAATYIQINGIIRINAAGTLIPQFTFSANPTGTITVKRNTFFQLQAIGDNTVVTSGTWS